MSKINTLEYAFSLSRTFNAPRELVFAAYSQCEHLKHWWGPEGWSLPRCEMDFREGGTWFYCMSGADENGQLMENYGKAIYDTIQAPEKIVYTEAFTDSEGQPFEGMTDMQTTVTFKDVDGQTHVTTKTVFTTQEQLDTLINMGMQEGLEQEWDKLAAFLPQMA